MQDRKTESDLADFSKEDMKEIQTITQSMKTRKQEKMKSRGEGGGLGRGGFPVS